MGKLGALLVAAATTTGLLVGAPPAEATGDGLVPAGGVLRVHVPDAIGGKTVLGQLTVDRVSEPGFVTAYGCDDGLPTALDGSISRSDLNYDGRVAPVASNRLIVEADDDGDVCFHTHRAAALVVDVNAVSFDTGITSFPNRRTDTRSGPAPLVPAGGVLRVEVPEAVGGATVIGQLTVDRVTERGYVTAYPCDEGLPTDATGEPSRSDLNYNGGVAPVASNRLIVEADDDGEICLFTQRAAAIVVDVNGISDSGITSFVNVRTDTRTRSAARIGAGGMLRVNVPAAAGSKTVLGQLTVDRVEQAGYVTAYGCDDGLPTDGAGAVNRSDLNYNGRVTPVASNRLIVAADDDGDVCFHTLRDASLVIDVNGVSDTGIISFPNQRTDTRVGSPAGTGGPVTVDGIPVWPSYEPLPPLDGVAALTGRPASTDVTQRPILAVKVDNYGRARPQWGLDGADAVIEENVEGVTRFVALFHSSRPRRIGPVRSARTADLDLLAAMNRPVFAYSGANPGVTAWVDSAARSGVLVDFTAQRRPCYERSPERPGPHNLLLDPACVATTATAAGPARPLWGVDAAWQVPVGITATADTTFTVPMDGVAVQWTWDPASRRYLRSQDGQPHVAASGSRIAADTVVEVFATHVPSPVDARSPNPITVGSGQAVVHRDGVAIPLTWSRPSPFDRFVFLDPATGVSVPLDVGVTFLELVRDR